MRHPPNLKVVGSNLSPKFTDDLNRNNNYISVRSFILTGAPYPSIEEAVKDILSPKDGTGIFIDLISVYVSHFFSCGTCNRNCRNAGSLGESDDRIYVGYKIVLRKHTDWCNA